MRTAAKFSVCIAVQRIALLAAAFVAEDLRANPPVNVSQLNASGRSAFSFEISPDGTRVVYDTFPIVVDPVGLQLHSAPITSGSPVRLNANLVTGGNVDDWQIGPGGTRVIYHADQFADELFELFIVPISGGLVLKVNSSLPAGGDVNVDSQIGPANNQVLYIADQNANDLLELFNVQLIDGFPDTSAKLNGTLVAGGDVVEAQFSRDGSRAIYLADQITDEVPELFTVPSAGGLPAVKLNGPLVPGGRVVPRPIISPDGNRVIYLAEQNTDNVVELFIVPTAGGIPSLKLNGSLVAGGNVDFDDLQFSPDGSRVVYVADQNTDNALELFSVPSVGGAAVNLSGTMVTGGDIEDDSVRISPDGTRVAYTADQLVDGTTELFIVPITGGSPLKLNPALPPGGDIDDTVEFTADSSHLLYIQSDSTGNNAELFTVSTSGGTPQKLSGPLVAGGSVERSVSLNPDTSRVAYVADQEVDNRLEIYIVPSKGGTPVKVNGPIVNGGGLSFQRPRFTPDGSRLVYTGAQDIANVNEVFARVVRMHAKAGGSEWDNSDTWDQDESPDEVMQVILDTATNVVVEDESDDRTVNEIQIGGGPATSMLTMKNSASVHAINGLTIAARGVIRGNGVVAANMNGPSFGEIRAAAGEQLRIGATSFTNSGLISALGSPLALAEVEIDGVVINSASTGLIAAQNGVLRFGGGVTNQGSILFSTGDNSQFGDINNTGRISVSAGATATFYDDVAQNGSLQVMKVGTTGSVATFAGAFTGAGGASGGGDIVFLGDLRLGNSPAVVNFANNVTLSASSDLKVELGGTAVGSTYDQIHVTGLLSLDGRLSVSLINGFSPALGNSFKILDATSLSGAFNSLVLPTLPGSLSWNTSGLFSSGLLTVAAALAGDYNKNGSVDAADYTIWRDTFGSTSSLAADGNGNNQIDAGDFTIWKTHFGEPFGSGGIASTEHPVPEPAGAVLIWIASIGLLLHRRGPTGPA